MREIPIGHSPDRNGAARRWALSCRSSGALAGASGSCCFRVQPTLDSGLSTKIAAHLAISKTPCFAGTWTPSVHPGKKPDLGRRSLIRLDEDSIETAETAKTRPHRHFRYGEVGQIEQPLCALHTGGFRDLQGRRVQVAGEEPRQLPRADAEPLSQPVDRRAFII